MILFEKHYLYFYEAEHNPTKVNTIISSLLDQVKQWSSKEMK